MELSRRFDLAALAKGRSRRGAIEFRPIGTRLSFEDALRRIVMEAVADLPRQKTHIVAAAAQTRRTLTRDAFGLGDIVGALRVAFSQATTLSRGKLDSLFKGEARRHDETWMQQVNRTIGIDLKAVVRSEDVKPAIDLAVDENVALIQGLQADVARKLQVEIANLVSEGRNNRVIAKAVADITGFAKKRAELIAVDQASKFNGNLNRIRQTQAGVTRYTWSTVRDGRVRPEHRAREGKTYRWDAPPPGGHPGQPIRCRCVARAVLDLDEPAAQRKDRRRARREGTRAVAAALGIDL